jgi:hypothetical protein
VAFKEWAVIVDALGRGRQIVILRKGGLREGRDGFQVDEPEFLLFPTQFHQQRESVLPEGQVAFEARAPALTPSTSLGLEFYARVISWHELESLEAANRLRGQHIWRDEVIAERFDWGKTKNIFALAVRVFRLPQRIELPLRPGYGGCKSWVELETDISTEGAQPVLSEDQFARRLKQFDDALKTKPSYATKTNPAR